MIQPFVRSRKPIFEGKLHFFFFKLIHSELMLTAQRLNQLTAPNFLLYRTENIWRDLLSAHVGEQLMWTAAASNHRGACSCAGVIAECNFVKRRSSKRGNSYSFTSPGLFQIKGRGQLAMRVL